MVSGHNEPVRLTAAPTSLFELSAIACNSFPPLSKESRIHRTWSHASFCLPRLHSAAWMAESDSAREDGGEPPHDYSATALTRSVVAIVAARSETPLGASCTHREAVLRRVSRATRARLLVPELRSKRPAAKMAAFKATAPVRHWAGGAPTGVMLPPVCCLSCFQGGSVLSVTTGACARPTLLEASLEPSSKPLRRSCLHSKAAAHRHHSGPKRSASCKQPCASA